MSNYGALGSFDEVGCTKGSEARLLLVPPTLSKPPELFRAANQIGDVSSHPAISTTSAAFEK